ncbi:MAG TPA: SCO family protein [Myxococcales bacterium]|nr:SCO family protein [Myxococcales bacterium]
MIAVVIAALVGASEARSGPAGGGYGYTPLRQVGDESVDVIERLGEPIPAGLRFRDSFRNDVALKDFFDGKKPVVVTLVYFECPMLCSLVMKGLVRALNETGLQLGKDYQGLTISFDPKDTPRTAAEAQRGYLAPLKSAGAARAQDWPFLTGGETNIHALAEALGFKYRYDAPTAQFAHPAVAFVLTPDGRISRYLYGFEFPGRDLRLSLVEASGGRVGTSFDRVLLKCFRYDPGTGRYRVYATNFVRGGAFASFLALALGLAILWRKEVARKRSGA